MELGRPGRKERKEEAERLTISALRLRVVSLPAFLLLSLLLVPE